MLRSLTVRSRARAALAHLSLTVKATLCAALAVLGCGGETAGTAPDASGSMDAAVADRSNAGSDSSTGTSIDASSEPSVDASTDAGPAPSFDASGLDVDGCDGSILGCAPPAWLTCWACVQELCSSQWTACAADATCNQAMAGALTCVDRGGDVAQCFEQAFASNSDPAIGAAQTCMAPAYGSCGCSTEAPPPPNQDAGLPLCGCTTGANGVANCVQTPTCSVPGCPVSGTYCCTSAGLCGCPAAVPGGPELTCN
jgi:hypothetical protein